MLSTSILSILFLSALGHTGHAKVFERKARVVHVESESFDYNQNWLQGEKNDQTAIDRLMRVLATSSKGRELLKRALIKARREGVNLQDIFSAGEKSYMDMTLIRRFSEDQSKGIEYKSVFKIFINRHLSIRASVLDMAHELIHYTLRETFNPYVAKFDLKHFISTTIEGKGGEVDAYLAECEVFLEIFSNNKNKGRCSLVFDPNTGKLTKALGVRHFYRIGRHYPSFKQKIKQHRLSLDDLSAVSDKQALFVSSAYDLPYPVAALYEYESILNKVCKNDSRRLRAMEQNNNTLKHYRKLLKNYQERCFSPHPKDPNRFRNRFNGSRERSQG